MRYLISYDLMTPGRNYQALYDALASIGAVRVLDSHWVTRRSNTTSAQLRDWIWRHMDRNDRLLVTAVDSSDWAGYNGLVDIGKI